MNITAERVYVTAASILTAAGALAVNEQLMNSEEMRRESHNLVVNQCIEDTSSECLQELGVSLVLDGSQLEITTDGALFSEDIVDSAVLQKQQPELDRDGRRISVGFFGLAAPVALYGLFKGYRYAKDMFRKPPAPEHPKAKVSIS